MGTAPWPSWEGVPMFRRICLTAVAAAVLSGTVATSSASAATRGCSTAAFGTAAAWIRTAPPGAGGGATYTYGRCSYRSWSATGKVLFTCATAGYCTYSWNAGSVTCLPAQCIGGITATVSRGTTVTVDVTVGTGSAYDAGSACPLDVYVVGDCPHPQELARAVGSRLSR
jgi:hypothetical protein